MTNARRNVLATITEYILLGTLITLVAMLIMAAIGVVAPVVAPITVAAVALALSILSVGGMVVLDKRQARR